MCTIIGTHKDIVSFLDIQIYMKFLFSFSSGKEYYLSYIPFFPIVPFLHLWSSSSTLQANFTSSNSKTYYFYADQGGNVNKREVTYRLGDVPVTVTATPNSGYQFRWWEVKSGGVVRIYDDRSASIIIDDNFYNYNKDGSEYTVRFDDTGTPVNAISISNVKFTGSGLTATVTSTYITDVNLEMDLSATYDYEVYGTDQTQSEYKPNVYDSQYITLTKGKSSWQINLSFQYSEGGGSGSDARTINNIRWEFGGNNGKDGNGTVIGNYKYYFNCQTGQLK